MADLPPGILLLNRIDAPRRSITDDREEPRMSRIVAPETGRRRFWVTQGYLASACWLGLVMGLVELGLLLIDRARNHVSMIGALQLNRHYPWMIPASHLAVFAAC